MPMPSQNPTLPSVSSEPVFLASFIDIQPNSTPSSGQHTTAKTMPRMPYSWALFLAGGAAAYCGAYAPGGGYPGCGGPPATGGCGSGAGCWWLALSYTDPEPLGGGKPAPLGGSEPSSGPLGGCGGFW